MEKHQTEIKSTVAAMKEEISRVTREKVHYENECKNIKSEVKKIEEGTTKIMQNMETRCHKVEQ